MLFALSAPDDAKLDAVIVEMDKLRVKARAAQLPPSAVPPLERKQLSFSPGDQSVDSKRVLLVDGEPELSHAAWTAAMKAGFDVRGGHIPTSQPASTFAAEEEKGT